MHGWSVHDMVAHVLGAARGHASPREFVRQAVHGRRHRAAFDGNDTDAMNAHQIERNAHLAPAVLIADLRAGSRHAPCGAAAGCRRCWAPPWHVRAGRGWTGPRTRRGGVLPHLWGRADGDGLLATKVLS
jgi:hypothetical protein